MERKSHLSMSVVGWRGLGRRPIFQMISRVLMSKLLISMVMACSMDMLWRGQVHSQETVPLRWLDLASENARQTIVDREAGQYLGHPTTLLLEDGKNILCVYPKGHGKGPIVFKRSLDGGQTWSDRLPTPENWATSLETPTIHRVVDAMGKKRLIVWSGLHPARLASSEDDGLSWTPLRPVGDWGGIVVMGFVTARTKPGQYVAMFHDDGRYFLSPERQESEPKKGVGQPAMFTLYRTESDDGGLQWSSPQVVYQSREIHLCEPGWVSSDDGRQWAVLLRENRRLKNSHVIFSDDQGATWTEPRELPESLTGDRHTGVRTSDGRLFISFRDMAKSSPTRGDWVAWVGTYQDIVQGKEGQYRIRLMKNHKGTDCAYPGVERLPDDTIVATTYGHWTAGESPYIVSIRLRLQELDAMGRELDAGNWNDDQAKEEKQKNR